VCVCVCKRERERERERWAMTQMSMYRSAACVGVYIQGKKGLIMCTQ
jgi:hypothetical protein